MKRQMLIWCIVCISACVQAQVLTIGCTSTDTSGAVDLSWQCENAPAGSTCHVYASHSRASAYALIGSQPAANAPVRMSCTHNTADACTQQWFYYVQLELANGTIAATSDTIANLLMVLTNPGTGTAVLDWLKPIENATGCVYDIYRMRGSDSLWYDSCSRYTYIDTVHECGERIGYKVLLSDSKGCVHASAWQTDLLTDFMAPAIPVLDTVSVDVARHNIHLGWNRPADKDVWGYIVYIFQDGIWNVADTVQGAENTCYTDNINSPNEAREYRICSIDTCRNASPLGDVHVTMLTSAVPDKCKEKVTVSWTAYQNMPGGVSQYRIYASENGGAYVQVGTVQGTQLYYEHTGVNVTSTYTYYAQAVNTDNGYTASALEVQVEFNRVYSQGSMLLRYVSVTDTNALEIALYVPDTILYKQLIVYKTTHGKSNFATFMQQNKQGPHYKFTDTGMNTATQNVYYYAAITDECDEVFAVSDTVCNIILSTSESSADMVELQWQPYEGYEDRLEDYAVERQTQTEPSLQTIGTVAASQTDYCDNVWNYAPNGAEFSYRVAAREGAGNKYGFADVSYSNTVRVVKTPIVWIPNTFRPNSEVEENRTFHPVISYVSPTDYMFCIYDRWGQLLFQTTNRYDAWDGTSGGKPVEMGVYVYSLQYRVNDDKVEYVKGTVTLLR